MTRENGGTVTDLLAAYISVWNEQPAIQTGDRC
jgi:hypothetical protein